MGAPFFIAAFLCPWFDSSTRKVKIVNFFKSRIFYAAATVILIGAAAFLRLEGYTAAADYAEGQGKQFGVEYQKAEQAVSDTTVSATAQ